MFKCKRCGACCGIVPFNRAEMKAARQQAREMGIIFYKWEWGEKTVYIPTKKEYKNRKFPADNIPADVMTCPFLKRDFNGLCSCAIYDIRPQVCRVFGHGGHPLLQCPNDPNTDTVAINKKIAEVLNRIGMKE